MLYKTAPTENPSGLFIEEFFIGKPVKEFYRLL